MFIIFTVFATLSIISALIFLVENLSHQRALRKYQEERSAVFGEGCTPIVITTVKNGKMYETYYYLPEDSRLQEITIPELQTEDSLLRRLIAYPRMSVN
jgi:hypothetical protein